VRKALSAPGGCGIIERTLWRGLIGDPHRGRQQMLCAHAQEK